MPRHLSRAQVLAATRESLVLAAACLAAYWLAMTLLSRVTAVSHDDDLPGAIRPAPPLRQRAGRDISDSGSQEHTERSALWQETCSAAPTRAAGRTSWAARTRRDRTTSALPTQAAGKTSWAARTPRDRTPSAALTRAAGRTSSGRKTVKHQAG